MNMYKTFHLQGTGRNGANGSRVLLVVMAAENGENVSATKIDYALESAFRRRHAMRDLVHTKVYKCNLYIVFLLKLIMTSVFVELARF